MKLRLPLSTLVFLCLLAAAAPLSAQVRSKPAQAPGSQGDEETASETPEQVIIQRDALKLIDPEVFQVPLQLVPSNFITIVSPATGVISEFPVEPGDRLTAQTELFRLEDSTQELLVKRAEAQVALQQLRLDQAKKKGDADAQAVVAAELKVAQLELDIANSRLQKTIVRTDHAAEVFRTYAVKGERVALYQNMMEIGNPTTMTVEIPVNRSDVKKDGKVSIKIEDREVDAKVVAILPPAKKFEPLRGLYDSLASARLEIENRDRRLKAGQAVYVSSIPREIVSEIPNSTIISEEEGQRKVQIIRKHVVRDILVIVLAPVGVDRSFVSGPFQPDDELILATSLPLADGTQLSPKVMNPATSDEATGIRPKASGF